MAPVNIGERQGRHLPGTQPEAIQDGENGEVPTARSAGPVAAPQQESNTGVVDRLRQGGEPPGRHRGDG